MSEIQIIEWSDDGPPERGGKRYASKWTACIAALEANPGRWAVVARFPVGDSKGFAKAGNIRLRILKPERRNGIVAFAHSPHEFESVTRREGDVINVYVRALPLAKGAKS